MLLMNSCSPIARQLGEIESIFRQKHFLARHSPAILASKGAKDLLKIITEKFPI